MAFKDLVNFQVDQELQESDPALKAEFDSEILRISNFIGFNILTYEPVLTGENPLTSLIDMETTETEMS